MRRWFPISVLALALAPAALVAADSALDYGFDEVGLQQALIGALRGWAHAPAVPRAVRAMPTEQRLAVVKALGGFTKDYFASADFKKAYDEARKSSKPRGFRMPSLSVDALKQKALDKATGKPAAPEAVVLEKDPKVTLKARLQAFLDTTADVDFDAETESSGGLKRFVNEKYEAKPPEWKMCYRAGKEVTEAVRAFAKDWISELP